MVYLTALLTFRAIHANAFAIIGFPEQVLWNNERPFRHEIGNFSQSGAAFDLYILALQNMTLADQDDFFSYFSISGEFPDQATQYLFSFQR